MMNPAAVRLRARRHDRDAQKELRDSRQLAVSVWETCTRRGASILLSSNRPLQYASPPRECLKRAYGQEPAANLLRMVARNRGRRRSLSWRSTHSCLFLSCVSQGTSSGFSYESFGYLARVQFAQPGGDVRLTRPGTAGGSPWGAKGDSAGDAGLCRLDDWQSSLNRECARPVHLQYGRRLHRYGLRPDCLFECDL